jgi:protein-S-isoprenylcysteine O-methyltransferase Ste14
MTGENRTVRKYLAWGERERPAARVAAGLAADFACFGLLAPAVVTALAWLLDRALGLEGFASWPATLIAGINLAVAGLAFWGWAVLSVYRQGRGSSLPLVPTRELVTDGPFALCRNPINLGAMIYYVGIALVMGSYAALALFALWAALLLLYIKLVEEKELAARFGEEYRSYREATPFILPRFARKETA